MILIFKGWGGIIVVVIPIVIITLISLLGLNLDNDIILGLALATSGILIWEIGKRLNIGEDRTLKDPETNEEVVVSTKNSHTLFFIPIQYYGIILGIFGILGAIGLFN